MTETDGNAKNEYGFIKKWKMTELMEKQKMNTVL